MANLSHFYPLGSPVCGQTKLLLARADTHFSSIGTISILQIQIICLISHTNLKQCLLYHKSNRNPTQLNEFCRLQYIVAVNWTHKLSNSQCNYNNTSQYHVLICTLELHITPSHNPANRRRRSHNPIMKKGSEITAEWGYHRKVQKPRNRTLMENRMTFGPAYP